MSEPQSGSYTRPRRRFRRRRRRAERNRAIFLLPNLFTTASLLLGFWSLVEASSGRFGLAALGIFLAGICDMLDGRIARATRSTSRFGVEYDSLADMVSFGVAPAFLVYAWTLAPLGRRGWAVAALFTVCAALRLARYNVQAPSSERKGYSGLPSTMAGGFVAVTIWFVHWLGLTPPLPRMFGLAFTAGFAGLALLMVSSVPYPSLGSLRIPGRSGFSTLVALTVGLVVILLYHEPALFAIGLFYVLSGPALWGMDHRARVRGAAPQEAPRPKESETDAG
jgi:CDP-diacylglycerol--serine O-phosphatidyltransferase